MAAVLPFTGGAALAAASVTTSPKEAAPGAKVLARGAGLPPRTRFQLTLAGSAAGLPSSYVGLDGTFSLEFTVPNVNAGTRTLAAVKVSYAPGSRTASLGTVIASTQFTVLGATGSGTCASTVHAKYVALAPDGRSYPTWHPQRDPSGCYFHHEHGSDARRFAAADKYRPTFGYVGQHAGQSEPHAGYKNFLYETNGYHWLFTVHIGTAGAARVCTRFHSIDLAVARISDRQLMGVVHFMGDFGRAEDNRTLAPLTPDACPRQYQEAEADGSYGVRQLSVNDPDQTQYEPWKPDLRKVILGIKGRGLEWNTVSAMTTCDGLKCNTVSPTGHVGAGAFRMLDHETGLAFVAGSNTGFFKTEPYGTSVGGTVQQYIRPGTNVLAQSNSGSEHAWPSDPYAMIYRCTTGNGPTTAASTNVDRQIRAPN